MGQVPLCSRSSLRAASSFALSRLKTHARRGAANPARPETRKCTSLVSREVLVPEFATLLPPMGSPGEPDRPAAENERGEGEPERPNVGAVPGAEHPSGAYRWPVNVSHRSTRTTSYSSAVGGKPVSNLAFTTASWLP
jgi:hypothetical protein